MVTYVDLRIDCDGQVLSLDRCARVPGAIRSQLTDVDTITHLMGWDASSELLYAYTMDGCAIRDVVLERLTPPVTARCSLFRSTDAQEILCRLAFPDGDLR